ncbi:unnamed protein product [Didymodactylos carnosus]|uniref:Uncharacterized protein n=1 Tax=Didymodactylos carnosus TaxID=1234261 RepID=A0A814P1P8_9BILA|nr:unnamed protein product [Didymodactylos carnosus]CAF1460423.1 unnamed protein product [Didymodactylos carnosus]CAF3864365.1 unnamed protein product [Didymodactylos carnosus]CAF4253821.1 unnamed protein product [Didymodactylos carnosus]
MIVPFVSQISSLAIRPYVDIFFQIVDVDKLKNIRSLKLLSIEANDFNRIFSHVFPKLTYVDIHLFSRGNEILHLNGQLFSSPLKIFQFRLLDRELSFYNLPAHSSIERAHLNVCNINYITPLLYICQNLLSLDLITHIDAPLTDNFFQSLPKLKFLCLTFKDEESLEHFFYSWTSCSYSYSYSNDFCNESHVYLNDIYLMTMLVFRTQYKNRAKIYTRRNNPLLAIE